MTRGEMIDADPSIANPGRTRRCVVSDVGLCPELSPFIEGPNLVASVLSDQPRCANTREPRHAPRGRKDQHTRVGSSRHPHWAVVDATRLPWRIFPSTDD